VFFFVQIFHCNLETTHDQSHSYNRTSTYTHMQFVKRCYFSMTLSDLTTNFEFAAFLEVEYCNSVNMST